MDIKIIIALFFITASVYSHQNFIINISSSEPLGIYKIHDIEKENLLQRGDVVAICLPAHYQDLGLKQGYLLSGIRCGKTAPLIKTIIAVPGDTVILKDNQIIINNQIYSCITKYVDSQGRKLEVFPRGVYKNVKTYWLMGTNDSNSWDARYWGGINRENILFKVLRY